MDWTLDYGLIFGLSFGLNYACASWQQALLDHIESSKHVSQVRSRYTLRCADGSVPAPPFDLCVACAECRLFQDATGILRTPQREQPAHYHLNISCIRVVATDFVPSTIVVPPDVLPLLGQIQFLCLVFGLFYLICCYCLYFSVMFYYNKLAPICSPVHISLLQVLKDGYEGHRTRLLENDITH